MFFFSSIISLSIRCNNYYFFYPTTDRNKKAGIFRFLLFRPNFQWFIFSILFIIHNNPGNNHNINIYRILVFEVFREALQCFGNVFFNCRGRYLKFVCYFTILQSFETAHQEYLAGTFRQLPNDNVDLFLQLVIQQFVFGI